MLNLIPALVNDNENHVHTTAAGVGVRRTVSECVDGILIEVIWHWSRLERLLHPAVAFSQLGYGLFSKDVGWHRSCLRNGMDCVNEGGKKRDHLPGFAEAEPVQTPRLRSIQPAVVPFVNDLIPPLDYLIKGATNLGSRPCRRELGSDLGPVTSPTRHAQRITNGLVVLERDG